MADFESNTSDPAANAADQHVGEAVEAQATGLAMGSASGHFSYDEATLKEIAKEWYSISDDINSRWNEFRNLANLQGPGKDPEASGHYGNMGSQSGKSLLEALKAQADYAHAQAEACRKAFAQYSSDEDDAASSFRKFLGLPAAPDSGPGGKLGHGAGAPHHTEGKLG